ncbi:hypothetical protein [Lactobacillus crispatus]|uniref:hypothetical protein n=1 Tax=Lactobacillus crispatus TaxID=47770 RepID=UPI00123A48A3|nr:hypothetical protein [Lactobacillus crispatus]KAA8808135.1 hypothetical protein F1C08_09685 [Lactobacillus crispatus]
MCKDRNGNAAEFGWQFQVVSGIIAALNDINNIKSINIEGPLQDVQLRLKNENEILIQAKSYAGVPVEENTSINWGDKLTSAMVGLLEDYVHNKNNVLKYYFNFPFPLGKEKGGKRNFGLDKYGEVYGNELTKNQKEIIKDKITSFVTKEVDKKGKESNRKKKQPKTTLTIKDITANVDDFIDKIAIRYCDFLNYKDDTRKYSNLEATIRAFLENNSMNVSISRLRDYWISKSFSNGSKKLCMNRDEFLFGIIIIKNSFHSEDLMGHKLNVNQINNLYDRFRSVMESTFALEDFNRELLADLFAFENINSLDEYQYFEDKATKFINKVYAKYIKYFDLKNITEKETY